MTTEKMTDRVRKLFAKAESTSSPHEAEALLSRAYALLAKYGIDEAVAKAGAGTDSSEIGTWTFEATGKYVTDQILLVNQVAQVLHCSPIKMGRTTLIVYGARRHLDRVEMLAGMLVAYMLGTAGAAVNPHPRAVSTVTYRKSVMLGFMVTVGERLAAAEKSAVDETGDTTGTEVVLASDARRAAEEMARQHPYATNAGSTRRSAAGFDAGVEAGSRVDLGGARVGGRAAIGA